jgi:hypothetical protein
MFWGYDSDWRSVGAGVNSKMLRPQGGAGLGHFDFVLKSNGSTPNHGQQFCKDPA